MDKQLDWKRDKYLKALLLIANKRIRKDFENDREVHYIVHSLDSGKEYIVKRIWKNSHEIFTCDCDNCLKATIKDKLKESPFCKHKLGVVLFINMMETFQ